MNANAVEIRNAVKKYGDAVALDHISLHIRDNEFFTLLGPSGCGKTTMLRIIAGFEMLNAGEVYLYGEEIERLPPYQRPVNTVFQNYALFPHMTVLQNVRFGLERRGAAAAEANKRALEMLELVRLSEYAARKPAQLSGGQQQRVALARALAPAPKVLLLDESLSALDLKLRQAMRYELKQIQRDTGITFIFVTHDQDEALTMSDRIAVMSAGRLQQVGTAREIYEQPDNRFVADFIGETNLLDVAVQKHGDTTVAVMAGGHQIVLDAAATAGDGPISIRPERIHIMADDEAGGLSGVIERNVYVGALTETSVRLCDGGPLLMMRLQNSEGGNVRLDVGRRVRLRVEAGAARRLNN